VSAQLSVVAALPSVAHADTTQVAVPHIKRPLVLPKRTLRIDGGPRWPWPDTQFKLISYDGGEDLALLNVGAAYSFFEDLEFAAVVPLAISPDLDLHDPRVAATYRIGSGTVEWGVFGQMNLPFEGDLSIMGGVPLYLRVAPSVRIDTGGFAQVIFANDAILALHAPVVVPIQLSHQFFLGPESGLTIWDFDDVIVPVGIFAGYSLAPSGPLLGDLVARFRLPSVEIGFDVFEFMVGSELYFDL
jgi:hypothetical protein